MDSNQYPPPYPAEYPPQTDPSSGYDQPPAYQPPDYDQPGTGYAPTGYDQPPAYQEASGYDQPYAYPPNPYGAYAAPMPARPSGMAIASLVLSLLGIFPLYLVGPILGVIFGHMALSEIKRSNGTIAGRGMAVAGLVIGYVLLGLTLVTCCGLLAIGIAQSSAQPSSFVPQP